MRLTAPPWSLPIRVADSDPLPLAECSILEPPKHRVGLGPGRGSHTTPLPSPLAALTEMAASQRDLNLPPKGG